MPGAPGGAYGSYTGTSKRDALVDSLVNAFGDLEPTADREATKLAVDGILAAYFGAGSIISLVDIGADLFDFSIGTSLSQLINPLLKRRIINPLEDVLRTTFRTDSPNARIVLAMLEDGVITPEVFESMLIDNEVKDAYLPLMRDYADKKIAGRLLQEADRAAKAEVDLYASQHTLAINRAESEVTALEGALDTAEVNKIIFPLQRQLRISEAQATRIDHLVDTYLFGLDKASANALEELTRITAQDLPKYVGSNPTPSPVTITVSTPGNPSGTGYQV